VNVAGIDDFAFADTLFGHTKGAYTGAHQARGGLVERASAGTLFLDEIGDLNFSSQIKLLRLMQNREYYPIGADQPKFSDACIIVATNSDLGERTQSGKLRQDLYYRLQTHHIHIPPLRERIDDIKILVEHFLKEAAGALNKKKPTAPEELYTMLCTYHFPGNIRELQSMVFDAVSRHESRKLSTVSFNNYICEKNPSKIPAKITDAKQLQPTKVFNFSEWPQLPFLKEAEEGLIVEALKRSQGNQNIAARLLGISRQALNRRLKAKSGR
jgi:transcriptional regulator with PAS, ATPase and Fis domain